MSMHERFRGLLAGLAVLLLAAPSAAATVGGSGQAVNEVKAGAQAMADADVQAHVDASGAVEEAGEAEATVREEATARYRAAVETATRAQAEGNKTAQTLGERDLDTEARVRAGVGTVDKIQAHHRDEANESVSANNELVDAGADAGVVAEASAFLEGTTDVLIQGAAAVDEAGNRLIDAVAEGLDLAFGASSDAEGQATATGAQALQTEGPDPGVEPEASVDVDASTVTEVTTEGRHQAQGDADA